MLVSLRMPALAGFLLGVFSLCWNLHQGEGRVIPEPKQNVWVTLANMTHQEALCLSTANPENHSITESQNHRII